MSGGTRFACPFCHGVVFRDRGPLDAAHCRDCGFELHAPATDAYEQLAGRIFVHRRGHFQDRPNPFPMAPEAKAS